MYLNNMDIKMKIMCDIGYALQISPVPLHPDHPDLIYIHYLHPALIYAYLAKGPQAPSCHDIYQFSPVTNQPSPDI